jgi:hypothetical protein
VAFQPEFRLHRHPDTVLRKPHCRSGNSWLRGDADDLILVEGSMDRRNAVASTSPPEDIDRDTYVNLRESNKDVEQMRQAAR